MHIKKQTLLVACAVLTTLTWVGCATNDPGITTAVKSGLAKDERTSAMKIDVDTKERVVSLSGTVPTAAEKAAAEQIAKNTEGVTSVVNNIAVAPASVSATGSEITVGTITGNLNQYLGKTVTVVADVQEVLGPRAFTLDEDDALAGGIDNDMLVLSPQAANLKPIENNWLKNKVRVTGTVGRTAIVEIEREIGWDLDREIKAELEDVKAVLIASSVERVQN
jgi:BON domain